MGTCSSCPLLSSAMLFREDFPVQKDTSQIRPRSPEPGSRERVNGLNTTGYPEGQLSHGGQSFGEEQLLARAQSAGGLRDSPARKRRPQKDTRIEAPQFNKGDLSLRTSPQAMQGGSPSRASKVVIQAPGAAHPAAPTRAWCWSGQARGLCQDLGEAFARSSQIFLSRVCLFCPDC
jgi:hypothetical protein